MREHKYKAKRLDGQWVEGYYWQNGCGNHFIRVIDGQDEFVLIDAEIDPDTLCEFTGLFDKNRNMIWEHDIIEQYGCHNEIKFGIWNCGCCYDVYGYSTYDDFDPDNVEIIGNIFDNPELLKVKDESIQDTLLDLSNYCIMTVIEIEDEKILDKLLVI